ncbi:MAG: hypothetical protein ABR536_01580 [Solirubrobacterales bacterium]
MLLAFGSAYAHEGDPNIDTVILGVRPALPGVAIDVVQNVVPALSLRNSTRTELEVLDRSGVPFLRIGPRGAEGNLGAAAFYRSAGPSGAVSVPANVAAGRAPTRWALLSRRPAWAWYDDRVPNITAAPPAVRGRLAPSELAGFSIPLRLGAQRAAAEGEVEYVPPRALPLARLTSPTNPAPGVTVALLAGSHPDLYLQDSGTQTVTVLGQQGEPFAQIGPHGVLVNLRSPIHAADATARGQRPEVQANPAAHPLWRRVSSAGTYDWLDPRPRLQRSWTVPILVGTRRLSITGALSAPPPVAGALGAVATGPGPRIRRPGAHENPSGSSVALWVGLGGLAVLAATVFAVRRVRT